MSNSLTFNYFYRNKKSRSISLQSLHNSSFFTGYAETIGGMIEKESGISRRDWHEVFSGVQRRETLLMAATALAHSYHKTLLAKVDDV